MSTTTTLDGNPSRAELSALEDSLRADAIVVEQLRREIAEAAAKGSSASKEKFAEFAERQKAYLHRKIELAARRKPAVHTAVSCDPPLSKIANAVPEVIDPPAEIVPTPRKATGSAPRGPEGRKLPALEIALWVLLAATIGLVGWLLSHARY